MANAATWAERVGEWRQSGLSAVKFVEGRDFSTHQLFYWSVKVRRAAEAQHGGATPGPVGPTDIRLARVVRVPTAGTSSAPVVVELHGVRVVLSHGFDRATFSAVLDEVEARATKASRR